MKHHPFHSRPPTHLVPRIITLPNPTAALRSFAKLEHVLPGVRVEAQPADASFCDMDWALAELVSLPLVWHLQKKALPLTMVTPEVKNENQVLTADFGHGLHHARDNPESVRVERKTQHLRRWSSARWSA
jgi:hypothetical protein